MICLSVCLDQVGMLFLSDLSRQKCIKYAVNRGSTLQIHQRVTEKRRGFADNTHRWRQVTRCVGHEIALPTEYAESNNKSSHCLQSVRFRQDLLHCFQSARFRQDLSSARINQKTRLVVGTNKDLALLRVRGEGQHNTIRGVTLDEDRHEYRSAHVRGMTSTPQCAM